MRDERTGEGSEEKLTTRSPDRSDPVQFPDPHGHVRPRLGHMFQEVLHPPLPPLDAFVVQRDFGRQVRDAVLTTKEGKVPYCKRDAAEEKRLGSQDPKTEFL